jgi:hypothetical protein
MSYNKYLKNNKKYHWTHSQLTVILNKIKPLKTIKHLYAYQNW